MWFRLLLSIIFTYPTSLHVIYFLVKRFIVENKSYVFAKMCIATTNQNSVFRDFLLIHFVVAACFCLIVHCYPALNPIRICCLCIPPSSCGFYVTVPNHTFSFEPSPFNKPCCRKKQEGFGQERALLSHSDVMTPHSAFVRASTEEVTPLVKDVNTSRSLSDSVFTIHSLD